MTIIYHLMIFVVAWLSSPSLPNTAVVVAKRGALPSGRLHLQLQLLIDTFLWQPLKLAWEFKPLSFCS